MMPTLIERQDSKHRYKQTDNIDVFLKFLKTVGMPRVGCHTVMLLR